jgi:hypothetical protein
MTVEHLHPATGSFLCRIFIDGDLTWPVGEELSEDVFFKDVCGQGMAPLLFGRVAAAGNSSEFPAELVARLRAYTMHHAAKEILSEFDVRRVLSGLAGIGVQPLLFKGTPLSHTLYPAPGLRPRCDTDMLVSESDRQQVAEMMTGLGYQILHEGGAEHISSQMTFSRRDKQGHNYSYDIHWQLSNNNRDFSRAFADDRLFADGIPVPALGQHAITMNHADALIYACFHRAGHFSHSGDRLVWLYDIHLLCQALNDEQVVRFKQRARELAIIALCVDAITVARSWFGTVLLPELESLLDEDAGQEASSMYLESGRNEGIKNHALLQLKGMADWREKVRFLLQNAFPPVKYMLWRYNTEQKILLPWLYLKRFMEGVFIFLRR